MKKFANLISIFVILLSVFGFTFGIMNFSDSKDDENTKTYEIIVEDKIDVFEGEIFDLIISNPPYIPYGTELSAEVQHEPNIALFAEENGIAVYRKIIEQAPHYLIGDGYLMFELGINEAQEIKQLMLKDFKNITIMKDLAGIERVIYGQKK